MTALTFCPHSPRKATIIPLCYISCFARSDPLKSAIFVFLSDRRMILLLFYTKISARFKN